MKKVLALVVVAAMGLSTVAFAAENESATVTLPTHENMDTGNKGEMKEPQQNNTKHHKKKTHHKNNLKVKNHKETFPPGN